MELLPEILKFGSGGIIGAVFFWLYLQERADHAKTRQEYVQTMNARIEDSKSSTAKVTDALSSITNGINAVSDKLEISRRLK